MNGITVTMAIVDFIPVVLFFIAAVLLQRDLYNKMVKGAFALMAAGSIMVLISGIYKAAWKILYALGICDFQALDTAFFPMQAPGFLLVFLGLMYLLRKKKDSGGFKAASVAAIPVYSSSLMFVVMQVIGCGGMQWVLFTLAGKLKKTSARILFAIAFIAMLGMGYLSAKFDDSSSMHWIAQAVNIVSQGALLGGVLILHKGGLGNPELQEV